MIYQAVRTEAEVLAVRANIAGTATPEQQKMAMDWIMREACMINRDSFVAGHPDVGHHGEGRRYAGIQIRAMLTPEALAAGIAHDKTPVKTLTPRRGKQ